MRIDCPECGTEVLADDLNIDRLLAKCRSCNAVFGFSDQLPDHLRVPALAGEVRPRAEVPLPKGFEVRDDGKRLEIRQPWYSVAAYFMIPFTLFWNAFMAVWYGIAFTTGMWPMAVFGLLHLGVGVAMVYGTVCMFVNSTTLQVEGTALQVNAGPIPAPWMDVQVDRARIEQLFVKKKVSHGKNGSSTSYEVHALLDDRTHQKLVTGLNEADQALFLEQRLESFLGITDAPVEGELERH